jgi:hypothetical protein
MGKSVHAGKTGTRLMSMFRKPLYVPGYLRLNSLLTSSNFFKDTNGSAISGRRNAGAREI